jgi:phospholipase C
MCVSAWQSTLRMLSTPTLLIVTFDEHGGCLDHVAPPSAPPPNPAAPPGELGFRFDRLGVRVPTILVSAYIDANTVLSPSLQATSVIKTLSQKWGLGSLTQRDQLAPDFAAVFNRSSPRVPAAWPVLKPRPAPDVTLKNAHLLRPLNSLQRDIVDMVSGLAHQVISPEVRTVGHALEHMQAVLSSVKVSFGFCSP